MTLQNKTDQNVGSKMVQCRISSLPVLQPKNYKGQTSTLQTINNGNSQYKLPNIGNIQNKGKFIGENINGKPDGFGKMYFENQDYL